ncbi:MAG: tetratricopeptide repeat protein [Vitreimonas sp.]
MLNGARTVKLDRGLDAFERHDWKQARRLLEEANKESSRAIGCYHLGLLYWRGLGGPPNKAGAANLFARAAADGYPRAQTAYGIALRSGIGVAKDLELARQQFRFAAGAGDGEAMVQIAFLSDPEEGLRWLSRASEMGYAPAMAHLADRLMEHDPVDALSWLCASVAISGDDVARKRAAALAQEMTAAEIEEAQKIGKRFTKDLQTRADGPR